MDNTRIKISSIVESQLPLFVRENFPLAKDFLTEYYRSLDFEGGVYNILQNIDKQIKVDRSSNLVEFTTLSSEVSLIDNEIFVESTEGFPDRYGLIKIDSEVILYKSKSQNSFQDCVRGFSAITSYTNSSDENFIFEDTLSESHSVGTQEIPNKVINLSVLFLKIYYNKTKKQFLPGFEGRKIFGSLNSATFLKNSKDFYSSKGTEESFKILFRVLFGTNVDVIKPSEYLIQPSDAQYRITKNLVVEEISGNILELKNKTIFQDNQGNIKKAFGTVTDIEEIFRDNKKYYTLKLDNDFNKDINVVGTVFGDFSIHPKTKITKTVKTLDNSILVDSTIGFPQKGTLVYSGLNGNFLITYEEKTFTQFKGCSGIIEDLVVGNDISLNVYAFGISSTNEEIRFRIGGVVSNVNVTNKGKKFSPGDILKVSSYGYNNKKDFKSNNWIFNVSVNCDIKQFSSEGSGYYKILTYDNNNIRNQDFVEIDYSTKKGRFSTTFKAIVPDGSEPGREFIVNKVGEEIVNIFSIRKVISQYEDGSPSDIINTYKDQKDDSLYIASNSLPNYGDTLFEIDDFKVELSKVDNFTIYFTDHGFITGDAVLYSYDENHTGKTLRIDPGIYYVKFINESEFKLSRSKENIEKSNIFSNNSGYVKLLNSSDLVGNQETGFENNFISLLRFSKKDQTPDNIGPQKLVRKILNPKTRSKKKDTPVGATGIFLNGVEVLNYKSNDSIFYGGIETIDVVASGSNYSITNPPELKITSGIGNSAVGYCGLEGTLSRIDIIDPGFDYIENPIVNIVGGSGKGAKASANLIPIENSTDFDSSSRNPRINLFANQVGFGTFHRFKTGEIVNYSSNGQTPIQGLVSGSNYFVSVIDDFTVKFFRSFKDSINNTNEIAIGDYGEGGHTIKSKNKKFSVGSISILDGGSGYKNKKIIVSPTGVNTSFDQIEVYEHPYQSGEIITYDCQGEIITGLSTGSYYVTRLDSKKFKLSEVGIGTIPKDFYYQTQQYVKLKSSGSGKHVFNYEPIKVSISGYVGVSTINQKQFNSILRPIVRGSVTSVFVENPGVGYGSSEIINYNRQPEFSLDSGSGAEVIPVISNGKIESILILNSGSNYKEPPEVIINGTGTGAVLTPIIDGGKLKEVKVIFGGFFYEKNKTTIDLVSPGQGCALKANIKKWTINNYERLLSKSKIGKDDGTVYTGLNPNYGLQYTHLYAPRNLRKKLFSKSVDENKIVFRSDYSNDKSEIKFHSPIIGWAYDGNPIYGPYGYKNVKGNNFAVSQMVSGYDEPIDNAPGRPSKSIYPKGFFVEDYIFSGRGDLDENNGRFCVTPEFPQGTYAYFCTISKIDTKTTDIRGNGIFNNDREPKFPYIIGNSFNSDPIEFNFNLNSNQDKFDLSNSKILRNTFPYNSNSKFSEYKFIKNTNTNYKLKDSKIQTTYVSGVDDIKIRSGGENYSVNDSVIFDNEGTGGSGANFKVSEILGKEIESIDLLTSSFEDVEFSSFRGNSKIIGFTTIPHKFNNNDILILNSPENQDLLKGSFKSEIMPNTLVLLKDVEPGTGVEYFQVDGALEYPYVKENDVYTIDSEKIKILNVDKESSRIRVLRSFDSTIGDSHKASTLLVEDSNKIVLNYDNSNFRYKINREYYFDPIESVGLGTERTKKVFANPGSGVTSLIINPRSIYLKNHKLETGTLVSYVSNGFPIAVSTNGVSPVTLVDNDRFYVTSLSEDFIGISTSKVGLNTFGEYTNSDLTSELLYFNSVGVGSFHSFKTIYDNTFRSNVSKNLATVSTSSSHGLSVNDVVDIKILSGITTTKVVKYSDFYRRIIIDEVDFDSSRVNVDLDTIRIDSHGFLNGQKVIYTSTSPSSGLVNNEIYYIIVYDKNRIRLSSSKYDSSIKKHINIETPSFGTLSPINPPINVIKNSKIIFDLSDPSLSIDPISGSSRRIGRSSAFTFNLYKDSDLSDTLFLADINGNFKIATIEDIGKPNARLEVAIDSNFPEIFYYDLKPVDSDFNLNIKRELQIDKEVDFNNQILLNQSSFSGRNTISSVGLSTFSYNVSETNEIDGYTKSNSNLSYSTTSENAKGPISKFKIISNGFGYQQFPFISGIISEEGKNAILIPVSYKIGSAKDIEIRDIGYEYSVDKTISPFVRFPQLFKVEPLSNISSIGISSVGRNYNTSPDLIVKDSLTNSIVEDIVLDYDLEKSKINIVRNSKGFYNNIPQIIPTNNTNGVKISNATYDSSSKNVTLTLNKSFSSEEEIPFEIGDRIIVEGISSLLGVGYNSKNYNYTLFKIIDVNNSGPLTTISYSLNGIIEEGKTPGTFDGPNSSGIVTPEKYFPTFNVILGKNNFVLKETVKYGINKTGTVLGWDSKNEVLKISTEFDYEGEKIIRGLSSNSEATITQNESLDFNYEIDSSSVVKSGWNSDRGFLNNSIQRLPDNDYYQYFSYSLKSIVGIDEWKTSVNDLNHTVGFKKFSDLQVISNVDSFSGISTEQRKEKIEVVLDLNSQVNINCIFDFDLATENYFYVDDVLSSDEIYLDSKTIQDYSESIGNRVLIIDDISKDFNTRLPATFVTSFNI